MGRRKVMRQDRSCFIGVRSIRDRDLEHEFSPEGNQSLRRFMRYPLCQWGWIARSRC
ncbi:hypothetical protein BDV26DRAFT_256903, partial [Aspergillus bertholletiae]